MKWTFANIFASLLILILGGATIYFSNREPQIPQDKVLVDRSFIDSLKQISEATPDTVIEYKDTTIVKTQIKYIEPKLEAPGEEISTEQYLNALNLVKLDVQDSVITDRLSVWSRVQFDYEKIDEWGNPVKSELEYIFKVPSIIEKTIHKSVPMPFETVKYVEQKKSNLYATISGHLGGKFDTFIPSVGLTLTTKKGGLYGVKIGYFNNKPVYGLTLGLKLN